MSRARDVVLVSAGILTLRPWWEVAVNRVQADDLVAVLAFSREEADAIVAYRTHGDFDAFDELMTVPGMDVDKLEERMASLRFFQPVRPGWW